MRESFKIVFTEGKKLEAMLPVPRQKCHVRIFAQKREDRAKLLTKTMATTSTIFSLTGLILFLINYVRVDGCCCMLDVILGKVLHLEWLNICCFLKMHPRLPHLASINRILVS